MERNTEERIRVRGDSDDNIYIDGKRNHQFSGGGDPVTMEFSEGTKLNIVYTKGLWKIAQIQEGLMSFKEIFKADNPDADDYSDIVELAGNFWWVRVGTEVEYIQGNIPTEFKELRKKCMDLIHEDEDNENGLDLVLLECWQHFGGAK